MKTYLLTLVCAIFSFSGLPAQAEIPVWLKKEADRNRNVETDFSKTSTNEAAVHPTFEGEVAVGPVWRMGETNLPQLGRCLFLRAMSLDDVIHPNSKSHHFIIRMSQERIEVFLKTYDLISKHPETNVTLFLDGRPEVEKWALSEDKLGLFYKGDVLQLISRLEACNNAISLAYTPDSEMTQMLYFSLFGLKEATNAALKELTDGAAKR